MQGHKTIFSVIMIVFYLQLVAIGIVVCVIAVNNNYLWFQFE